MGIYIYIYDLKNKTAAIEKNPQAPNKTINQTNKPHINSVSSNIPSVQFQNSTKATDRELKMGWGSGSVGKVLATGRTRVQSCKKARHGPSHGEMGG